MNAILLAAIGFGSLSIPVDSFDRVELNHAHTSESNYRFSQLVCWDFVDGQWVVQGWVMVDVGDQPHPDWAASASRTGRLSVIDTKGVRRILLFNSFSETATAYDPEVRNRAVWPVKSRRGLTYSKRN